jgi:hypothetical protein
VIGVEIQLGDLAAWVSGLLTGVALVLTALLLKLTRQEQRAEQSERREVQARRVKAWVHEVHPDLAKLAVEVRVSNASREPAFNVIVAIGAAWRVGAPFDLVADLPFVVGPDYDRVHTVELKIEPDAIDTITKHHPPVEILLSDVNGRYWRRDRFGRLERLSNMEPFPAANKIFFTTPDPIEHG